MHLGPCYIISTFLENMALNEHQYSNSLLCILLKDLTVLISKGLFLEVGAIVSGVTSIIFLKSVVNVHLHFSIHSSFIRVDARPCGVEVVGVQCLKGRFAFRFDCIILLSCLSGSRWPVHCIYII